MKYLKIQLMYSTFVSYVFLKQSNRHVESLNVLIFCSYYGSYTFSIHVVDQFFEHASEADVGKVSTVGKQHSLVCGRSGSGTCCHCIRVGIISWKQSELLVWILYMCCSAKVSVNRQLCFL